MATIEQKINQVNEKFIRNSIKVDYEWLSGYVQYENTCKINNALKQCVNYTYSSINFPAVFNGLSRRIQPSNLTICLLKPTSNGNCPI